MVTKQTAKTQETSSVASAVKRKLTDVHDAETAKYIEIFGKSYLKALALAGATLSEVVSAEVIIAKVRGGNAKIMLSFARECVKLTMDGDKADLPKAAELLKLTCAHAETALIEADAAEREDDERPIAEIAPSWPPMRTNLILGMSKAGINPLTVENFTAIEKGYKEWKAKPINASDKDNRGRKAGATDKAGSDKERTAKAAPAIVEHETAKSLSIEFKQAIAEICKAAALCSENQQAEISGLLRSLAADWTAKGQAYQAEYAKRLKDAPTEKRHPAPAREASGKGATAD